MTNYIEQMMKIAGVAPTITYFEKVNPLAEISAGKSVTKARNFTAEKQLELIKLIANQNKSVIITSGLVDHEAGFLITKDSLAGGICVANKDFPQALAQLTIELMNAGELDKEKVKEVLQ